MINVLYTLFIFPIEQILELCFVFVLRVIKDPALSVLGISFAVSTLTLPLYLMGERHQRSERDIQKQMKPEVDNIKAVFSGDERFMRLAVYYRQNGYHPLYSLRSSIPLLIQIPFFIAAYHFLSNMEMINGVSFGPIADLIKPDSLLIIKNTSINILPIVMTLINLISAMLYVKGFSARDKIQLYGMAALFLILLYNSPSILVVYWTGNNFFSLVKNIIYKTKKPKLITLALVSVLCLFLDYYLLFLHKGWIVKRVFIVLLITFICLSQYLSSFLSKIRQNCLSLVKTKYIDCEVTRRNENNNVIFILSLLILFLLTGFVIPSSLIASSVQEFSFIFGEIINPLAFIGNAVLQSFGIFVLWPLLIYLLFSKKIKIIVTKFVITICAVAVVNTLLFQGNYGFLTTDFIFSRNIGTGKTAYFINLFVIAVTIMLALFFVHNFRKVILSGLIIVFCTMLVFGSINSIKIHKEFLSFSSQYEKKETVSYKPVFQFSQTGKNVLVIMLDKAISGYIPYIFDEKNNLYDSFDGFTWYKNSISFGGFTNFGTPGIFGGYEYTPTKMNAKNDIPLVKKQNEALLLLPRIFLDKNYKVTVTDPPYANYSWIPDLSIFDNYPEIHAENIIGKYNKIWLINKGYFANPDIIVNNTIATIKADMIRFSFFKIAPLLFRNFIYDHGKWLYFEIYSDDDDIQGFNQLTLNNYIALDILDKITEIKTVEFNTYTAITNDLTHEATFLQFPDYVPSNAIIDKGNGQFANEDNYHVNIASLLLLGKFFDFLKENDVYNNTRIIIVSDHGRSISSKFPDNIILPNNESLQAYTALLLVKDFNSHGRLLIDDSFMTNADVPLIALGNIVENPVNPWTKNIIKSDKENGITLTTSTLFEIYKHPVNTFDIKPDEWLHVHTNIYNLENWSQVNRP
jgi:YidC/Oxa1 family membrane protein insertase